MRERGLAEGGTEVEDDEGFVVFVDPETEEMGLA